MMTVTPSSASAPSSTTTCPALPAVFSLDTLVQLFDGSMSAQQEVRQTAEKNLALLSARPSFLPLLLSLLNGEGAGSNVQMAAAIFLKNEIEKRWSAEGQPDDTINSTDREAVRSSIVPCLLAACSASTLSSSSSSSSVVSLLKASVRRIIRNDFPGKWGSLLGQIEPLLKQSSAAALEAGLILLYEVIDWKGFEDDAVTSHIYTVLVPLLLPIGQAAMSSLQQSEEAARLLKSVLKIVYSCIAFKWNAAILGEDTAVPWITLITQTVQQATSPGYLPSSETDEERAARMFWKARKWAFHCQNRIFTRHGCPDGSSFQAPKQSPSSNWSFAKFYMANLAALILQVNLDLIGKINSGSVIITDRIYCLLCDYLGEVIRNKRLLDSILPSLPSILSQFAFPRLCFSEADRELWEDDPLEYCRSMLDPFDDYYSAQAHSANLFIDLCKTRKKHVFPIVLQLITQVMNEPASDEPVFRRKDGCLFLVGSLAKILMKNSMAPQVESLFAHHLLPMLQTANGTVPGYLRVRACWMVEQFSDLHFSNQQVVLEILRALLSGLQDTVNLPVQVQSACTIGALIDQEAVQQALPSVLAPVVEAVLSLNSKVEVDSLATVLEKLVSMYSDELAPFATQLCCSVRDTAIRIVRQQLSESAAQNEGEILEFESTDRMMALVGMLRTIVTLVDSMSESPQLLVALEDCVAPLLVFILEHKVCDVYEEVFELLESFTYLRKTASANVWRLVEYIIGMLSSDDNYVEEIAGLVDNCVTYDPATFSANQHLQQSVLHMVKRSLTSSECSYAFNTESICLMMQAVLMNCGAANPLVPPFIQLAMHRISHEQCDTDAETIFHLEVVLTALFANPQLALQILEQDNATECFLAKLCLLSGKFKRVHDKRLMIASVSNMLDSVPVEGMPGVLQRSLGNLISAYVDAIETLPAAMAQRKKLQEEAENDGDSEGFEDFGDYDSDDYTDLDSLQEEEEGNDSSDGVEHSSEPSSSQQQQQQQRPQNSEDDEYTDGDEWEADELEEDIYFETALDRIDIVETVRHALVKFARSQSTVLNTILPNLTESHQNIVKSIIHQ